VRNLISNAAQHATSTVSVAVRADETSVVISVDDDGPGIAPADRQRIFERFVRLDEARSRHQGGSGLGLAIVHEVARAHGGTVIVDDAGLGGARFVVTFPRRRADEPTRS
jgi:signal transduction histidine kinase